MIGAINTFTHYVTGAIKREMADRDLICVGGNRITRGVKKRVLAWVEIRSECYLGDKRGWRYKEWHKQTSALFVGFKYYLIDVVK